MPFTLLPFSSFTLGHAQTVADKMVATVNGGVRAELITYSDLLWQLALQPATSLEKPTSEELNQALRLLEDQHLILQEAEKLPTSAPSPDEVQKARDDLARHFPSGELAARMAKVGLTSKRLDEIISDRLAMEKYLDFRFRSFVLITQKDISDYYSEVLVPQEKSHSRIVPTLDEAHDRIERTLTENKIEAETDAFLDSLRDRAEIVILNPV
ncbi:MAG: hypothetical protein ABJC05_00185 [Pyrinomonadaceae bacterium]